MGGYSSLRIDTHKLARLRPSHSYSWISTSYGFRVGIDIEQSVIGTNQALLHSSLWGGPIEFPTVAYTYQDGSRGPGMPIPSGSKVSRKKQVSSF